MKNLLLVLIAFITVLSVTSCNKDKDEDPVEMYKISIHPESTDKFEIDPSQNTRQDDDVFTVGDILSVTIDETSVGSNSNGTYNATWTVTDGNLISVEFTGELVGGDADCFATITIELGTGEKYTRKIEVQYK